MNKLEALNLGRIIGEIKIDKLPEEDMFAVLDDILSCGKIGDDVQKQVEALGEMKAEEKDKVIGAKLSKEDAELNPISKEGMKVICAQEGLETGKKALIYKMLCKE
jgi:hypothetical protein